MFNLKSEVSTTYLGYLWWILEPVLFVTVMYVVFGILLRTRTENFLAFLVCGQVPYTWFARSVSHASRSLISNRGLMNQVAIPKAFFPMLTIAQDMVKQTIVFTALFMFLVALGTTPQWAWLFFPFVALTQLLFVVAVGLMCAGIVPLVPDTRYLIGTLIQVMMYGSGIFYSYKDVLLPEHQELFLLNPMANLIKNYRQILLDGAAPDWFALSMISLLSLMAIFFMMWVFKRMDTTYARLAMQ